MTLAFNVVPVRARETYQRGLLHQVQRPTGARLDILPALCGLDPVRGWIPDPTFFKARCPVCDRRAAQLPDPRIEVEE